MHEIFELRRNVDNLSRGFEAYRSQALIRELQADSCKLSVEEGFPSMESSLFYLEEAIYKWRTLVRSHFPVIFMDDEASVVEISANPDAKSSLGRRFGAV